MGVVYLGRDPRLNRPVAIKVLPDALANPESVARFDREAKLLASLNHPNIATIYGVEESDRQRLLILEYIPGDTLALRIARGPLPIDEALDICRQIASAIEAAHEGGVIHRDLKPGNVKITPDGQVKVLDFGLAKGTAVSDAEMAHSPTMTFAATGMGVILGTAGYMSPEQARGKAVDRRTDIWSFGCVLFECLTGRQIFEGETVSDTIARILEREPDWTALPANTPPPVREILRRCLEKDLKKRQRDIGDVRIQLEEAIAERTSSSRTTTSAASFTPATSSIPARPSRARALALAVTMTIVGAAAGAGLWRTFGSGPASAGTTGTIRASVAIPRSIRADFLRATPDGQTLVLAGAVKNADGNDDGVLRLFRRSIEEEEFTLIAGSEGVQQLAMSPDSKSMAIIRSVSPGSAVRELVKISIDGSSPPVKIANAAENWLQLSCLANGDLIIGLAGGSAYARLPRGSATPGPEIAFDLGGAAGSVVVLGALPDDRGVLLNVESYTAKGWSRDAWVLDLATGKPQRIIENAGAPAYVPTGHIVFARGQTLMAAPFELDTLRVTGDAVGLSDGLRIAAQWDHGRFVVSNNGTVVSLPGGLVGADRRLVAFDAAGNATQFGTERRIFEEYPVISRDGRKIALVIANAKGNYDVWTADQDRPVMSRAIAIADVDTSPLGWSPDGQRLVLQRYARDKDDGLYVQNADGTGKPEAVITTGGAGNFVTGRSWTPDGSGLVASKIVKGQAAMYYVAFAGAGGALATPKPLREKSHNDTNGTLSYDGRFLAFESDESGTKEIYVAPWNPDNTMGRPVRVSSGGGDGLEWSKDNRVFYETPDAKLVVSAITATPALAASKPVVVHDLKKLRTAGWGILPDGRLFAIQRSEAEVDTSTFSIVFNWFDELKRRMSQK
jgi:eukaryotic-like serine/threonine-protein kinase